MHWLAQLRQRFAVLFNRGRFDRDLEEEMQAHVEMQAEENEAAGMEADEARYAARRQFGNATVLSERSRELWGWPLLESCASDLKLAVRALLRNPAFTALSVLTLALGIGANTAAFSVVEGVLLRPLPFRDPGRLVMVWDQWPKLSDDRVRASAPELFSWQARAGSLDSAAAMTGASVLIKLGEDTAVLPGTSVTAGFFRTLGVEPAAGRVFSQEEQHAGRRVAVIGYGLARRLGGNAVGKTLTVNGDPHVVIGVMPRDFAFPTQSEVWLPIEQRFLDMPAGAHNFLVVARLKPGITVERAESELEAIALPLQREFADTTGTGVKAIPLRDQIIGDAGHALVALFGVVACLLLIACANVANLSLSRAAGRRREIALRLSLGAGRWRVIRFLLAESAAIAFAGGILGLAGAYWAVRAFVASDPIDLPRVGEIAIDPVVLLFTFSMAVLTALLVGLTPALRVSRVDINSALKEAEGTRVSRDFRRNRARSVLAVAQVALAIVMLTGSGLLLRSFVERITVPLGFRPAGVLGVELPWSVNGRVGELLERLRALPGVEAAGAGTAFPHEPPGTTATFEIENGARSAAETPRAGKMVVTPGFFRAAGMKLLKGRFISAADGAGTPPVAVITEALARRYYPGEDAIGRHISFFGPWMTIVGVAGDVKGFGVDGPPPPAIYMPAAQADWGNGVYVIVRTAVPALSLAPTVRKEIRRWDKSVRIGRLAPIEQFMSDSVAVPRFYTLLVGAFAAIALAIAAVGIYGTLNYLVTQRTHEIGVRVALGAQPADVVRAFLAQGAVLVAMGLVFGLAGAWASTRVLSTLLFRVRPNDPAAFAGAFLVLAAAGLLACYVPARRATHVDPIEALRYE